MNGQDITILVLICLLVGALIGAAGWEAFVASPLRKRCDALRRANARTWRREHEDRLGRFIYRRDHLGTPYLPGTVAHALEDNDRWSRKAPELKAVP